MGRSTLLTDLEEPVVESRGRVKGPANVIAHERSTGRAGRVAVREAVAEQPAHDVRGEWVGRAW